MSNLADARKQTYVAGQNEIRLSINPNYSWSINN